MRTQKYFLKNFKYFFCTQKVEKTASTSCILMAVWRVFFSAAPPAQNSPELHFRSINSSIQPSVVESVGAPEKFEELLKIATYFYYLLLHFFTFKSNLQMFPNW